jgi:hypothetical protein
MLVEKHEAKENHDHFVLVFNFQFHVFIVIYVSVITVNELLVVHPYT